LALIITQSIAENKKAQRAEMIIEKTNTLNQNKPDIGNQNQDT